MYKSYFKIIGVFLFLSPALYAQNIGINTTGANPSVNAILDLNTGNANNLGLIIPNVTLGPLLTTFNPPIANAPTASDVGMMVFNSVATNQPIGYYYWSGTTWVVIGGGGGTVTGANDGTSLNGTNVILGNATGTLPGQLTQNTEVPLNGNYLSFSAAGSIATTGQVGIGLAAGAAPVSTLDVNGSYGVGTIDMAPVAGSSTALTNAYSTIIATPSAVATTYTLTLPSATANPRQIYTIVYNGGTSGTIDVTSPIAGNIMLNGVATTPLAITDAASIVFQSDGTNWIVTAGAANLGAQAIVVQSTGQLVNPPCCTQTLIPGLTTTITLPVSEYVVVSMAVGVGDNDINTNDYANAVFFVNIGINTYFICSGGANNSRNLIGCYQTVAGNYGVRLAPGTYTITIGGYDLNNNCFIGGAAGSALQGTMVVYAFPP